MPVQRRWQGQLMLLELRPIAAVRVGTTTRTMRWIQRHRASSVAILLVAVLIALAAGSVTTAQCREIAEAKLKDLNTTDLDAATKIIMGSSKQEADC